VTHEANLSNPDQDLRHTVETYLSERKEWMADAVGIYAPDRNRNHNPLEVFPEPTAVRAEAPDPELTAGQESALRTIAGRFGLGGEVDIVSNADYQINEGGKARKVDAEAQINQGAKAIIFASSPDRLIGEDEVAYMQERLNKDIPIAETEYDMVRQIACWQKGFVLLDKPKVLPYGYNIHNNFTLVHEPTGQLVKIGEWGSADVLHLRVDRENYFDEEGKDKFRKRPDSAALMGFISGMLLAQGDETSSVGINSSTTYASRAVDAVRAGLEHGRIFHVGMYGRQTLANVERKPVAEPTEIQHIPGELHEIQSKLIQLQAAFDERWPEPN
jgi:hypothetical protein